MVDIWSVGWLHFDTLRFTCWPGFTAMELHSGFKAGSAELLLSAGSQQCSSDCLFESICRMSATSCDSVLTSRGAPKGCQPLLRSWSGYDICCFSSPWPPQHCTRKGSAAVTGVSLAQSGLGAPHAAGEGNGINLQYYHTGMGMSPQKQLCAQVQPPDWPCCKCSRLLTLK